ncbi:MAG: hypothetical protein HGN29_05435 [Asgard group archaeon]|nr:hypothetical protein [Asgard group archaeon]
MSRKKQIITFTALCLILLNFSMVYTQGQIVGDQTERMSFTNPGDFLPKRIAILYDPINPNTIETARAIYETIKYLYSNVQMIAVYTPDMLYDTFKDEYWIRIYVFDTDLTGLETAGGTIQWRKIGRYYETYEKTHHIAVYGNAYKVAKMVSSPNCYFEEKEKMDVRTGFLHAIWSLSTIFLSHKKEIYKEIGANFQKVAIQYFASEFEALTLAEFDPQYSLGEEDPIESEKRIANFKETHPDQLAKIHPETGEFIEPTAEIPGFDPALNLKTMVKAQEDNDIILTEFPFLSSLTGAAGDVIQLLLELIGADIPDGVITVGQEFANSIKTIVEEIPKIIGLIKDPSASSALELFFDILKSAFPSLEKYKPYFDIASKAIFAIQEGPAGILGLMDDLLLFLIPESATGFVTDIVNMLNLTTEFYDGLLEAEKWSDYLMKHLNKQLIYQIIWKVANLVGGALNNTNTVDTITEMFVIGIEIISTRNYTSVVRDIIPYLGMKILGVSDDDTATLFEILGILLQMGLGAAGVLEVDFDDSAQDLFAALFPDVDFTLQDGKEAIQDLIDVTKQMVEGEITDYTTIRSNVVTVIDAVDTLSSFDLSASRTNVIAECITLAYKLLQNDFQIPSELDFISLITDIINEFYPSMDADKKQLISKALELASSLVAFVTDSDSAKIFIKGSINDFISDIGENPGELVKSVLGVVIPLISGETPDQSILDGVGTVVSTIVDMLSGGFDFSIQNILQTVVSIAGVGLSLLDPDIPMNIVTDIFNLFWSDKPEFNDVAKVVEDIITIIQPSVSPTVLNIVEVVLVFIGSAKGIFKDGTKWIMNQLVGWVSGKIADLLNMLTSKLNDLIMNIGSFLSFSANFTVGFGSFSAFYMSVFFKLSPGFSINKEAVIDLVNDLVFHGSTLLSSGNLGYLFKKILSAISIIPLLEAGLEVSSGTTGKDSLTNKLLDKLGVELAFSGSAGVKLQLMKIENGKISTSDFLKLIEFFFKFEISLSKTFPLAEFFFGPAVSVLAKVAEHLGLGGIYLEITFFISIEIVKRIDTKFQSAAEILTIVIGLTVAIIIDLSLVIVGITITFGFTVTLSFIQDFLAGSPLQVVLVIVIFISVKIVFLFWDWSKTIEFGPDPIYLAGGKDDPETREEMTGLDEDGDGLPDSYEEEIPGLKLDSDDSDGDGLSDKFEIRNSGTDPIVNDTDGDRLLDGYEYQVLRTNPLQCDSDFDGLTDYEEVVIYGTDPNSIDTDGDQLDDYYEVNTAWNITGIKRSVPFVMIGGVMYIDHTDPLNPDTDGDGILDGQEGPFGAYYGPDLYDDEDDSYYPDQPPIIYNEGYIHPLDNDTDDDSYRQLCNGTIAPGNMFLIPMTDKIEIDGQWVIFIEDDELIPRLVRTNPVNPDTDGDTGIDPSWRGDAAPINIFLKSDGYELWLDPPTDPNDADTDDDGLIDGFEGWGNPTGNHTDPNNADTDNDGLGDLQDILLGCDPLDPDSDGDGVLDGEEFFKYGTNPAYEDTDHDGLLDGEELYLFHTNPLAVDSDGDGIEDGLEVLYYDTNPMDEDEDNDGLTDWEEIFYHGTLPKVYDSDGDGLSDWEEVAVYYTHPLKWDTDNDTIWYPNEVGEMTFPMSDGDEIKVFGTNPLSSDSDVDGIYDCLELYLGSGLIPDFAPILLDPMSNDTDGDGLLDAHELVVANVTNIIYPYRSFLFTTPYNTSVVNPDTDGDGLLDGDEVLVYGTLANTTDSDGDGIDDGNEIFATFTNPLTSDTDGDALTDYEEIWGYPEYALDPMNPDVDGDMLPDGAEILLYGTNPNNPDEDDNGVLDGLETDFDFDGLEDGYEFFVYKTPMVAGGGVTQPDSDRDGLGDGAEVYLYGTNCTLWDTDNDTFSDGLEVMVGTDPLTFTTLEEFRDAIQAFERGVVVVSPVQGGIYSPSNFTFIIYNASPVLDVTYQMRKGSDDFSDNVSMHFSMETSTWMSTGDYISSGDYEVKFYVHHPDDTYTVVTRTFVVEGTAVVSYAWVIAGVGGGIATGVAGTAIFYLARAGKLSFLKRLFGGGGS